MEQREAGACDVVEDKEEIEVTRKAEVVIIEVDQPLLPCGQILVNFP